MLPLALAMLLAGGSACSLKVEPLVGQSPMNYLRVTTHFDNPSHWYIAAISLVDDATVITSTQLFEADGALTAPKTKQTEWKSLDLGPGSYEIQLRAWNREGETCRARQGIEVQ